MRREDVLRPVRSLRASRWLRADLGGLDDFFEPAASASVYIFKRTDDHAIVDHEPGPKPDDLVAYCVPLLALDEKLQGHQF